MPKFKSFIGIDAENRFMRITAEKLDPENDLLTRVQKMPPKTPVSLKNAWFLSQEDFTYHFFEFQDLDYALTLIAQHWVDHVAALGYHIVLDGSEYEPSHIEGPNTPLPQRKIKL